MPNLFATSGKRNALACLLLFTIAVALYNPVTRHPFVNYDDDRYVAENPHVREGLTWGTLRWSLTSTEQANWHPLTWMSHALDCSLFRLNPSGHHFTSVLLHGINAVLLFLLLMWATSRFWPSVFVAAAFAVHPINVESVAWIAERKNVLCTLFFFLTLWAYGWYARLPDWKRYLTVIVLFAAGLASKPMVITLPFVLLLMDYWPLERDRGPLNGGLPSRRWWKLVLEKFPLFVLSLAGAVITIYAQRTGGAVRSVQQFPIGVRLANALYAYGEYLWKMLWPAKLAPVYPHPGGSLSTWQVVGAFISLGAVTALVCRLRTRRYLLVGWLWFLGTLVPVIGLVQVGDAAMADRYAYIPLVGLFVMIGFGIADWAAARKLRWQVAVAACTALAALALATHRQIGYWQTNETLWSHTLAVTRNNFIAEDNLGGALILQGKEEEAYPHFETAVRINPRDPLSHSNLGTYFLSHRRMSDAIAQYQAALQLTRDSRLLAGNYANLGVAYLDLGDVVKARVDLAASLQLNPQQFNAWLGAGVLARNQGKIDEAINDFTHSLNLQPTARGYLELGRAYEQAGQIPLARDAYQKALKISPDLPEARQAADAIHNR